MLPAAESFAQGRRKTLTRLRIREEEFYSLHHLWDRTKVARCLTIRTKQLPMVGGIFSQNAPADCCRFEAAHRMPVAIGAADETEADPRGGGSRTDRILVGYPAPI